MRHYQLFMHWPVEQAKRRRRFFRSWLIMADKLAIAYAQLVQEALLGVVRTALSRLAAQPAGLGGHHFYLTLLTHAKGVEVSAALRDRFPEELTIVLQHRLWDLVVTDSGFSVRLTFGGVEEQLRVPFSALTRFADPHAPFALEFSPDRAGEDRAATIKRREPQASDPKPAPAGEDGANVVSLDRFRKP